MFKKILVLLVLVVFVAGCTGGVNDNTTSKDTNVDTQKLTDDISNIDTADTDLGTDDLDNIDIDTNLI